MAGYQQSKKALGAIRRWIEGSSGFFPQGFYISHEGLLLNYEGAMTRWVPEARAFYNLSAHTLWLGHRTQSLGGAHVEYFRGISNPIGLKVGPGSQPGELLDLIRVLNPKNKPGRLTLITRLGAKEVSCGLPPLVEAVEKAKQTVTWMVDPMHGNTRFEVGFKTRYFDDIASEWQETREIHHRLGTVLGGVHLEITPHPGAKECLGGIQNPVLLEDLSKGYKSLCDPRLNPQQVEDLFELLSLSKPQYLL
jgi:3-deoxy-7-phosphoheptulonate synthase